MQIFWKVYKDFGDRQGIKLGLSGNKFEIVNAPYITRSNWCGWEGWGRQELDTHTETKQRVEYQEMMVVCQEHLKEGLEIIALHASCIYTRAAGCRGTE